MADKQQNAVVVTEVGKPVSLTKRRIPSPQENEVLVKVTATHLLPHDSYGRDKGLFIGDRLPFVLGADVAGVIEQVGSSTSTFEIGDRVFGIENLFKPDPNQAGLQQYATLDVDAITKIPSSFSTEEAVTVPLNLITAFLTLFSKDYGFGLPTPWEQSGFDYSRMTTVILAAGSNVGKLAIQLAKIANIGRVIAVAGPANEQELKQLGATHFIDRHSAVEEAVKTITGPEGSQYVLDCYSWTYELAEAIASRTQPSRIVVVHRLDPTELEKRNPMVKAAFVQCSNANLAPHKEEFWKHMPVWLEKKQILPAPYRVIEGLERVDEINRALDDYRDAKGGPQAVVVPRVG